MAEREYIEIVTSVKGEEEVSNLKTEVYKLGKESQETGEQIERFDDSVTVATNKSKTLTQRLKELSHQFQLTGKESGNSSTSIIGAVKKYAAIGTVIAGVKKATNVFTAFDDEIRKVQATSGATADEMENLRNQAKELGNSTRWSASEAAEAQFEFAKAGFTANEILKATPGILNTATAGQLSLGEATEITSGTLRIFKLNSEQAQRVGDALAMTANSSTTDIRGLGESLKYAGLGATDFGLSLEQTLAILGTLGNNKIDSSMAGTGLRSVFAAFKDKNKAKLLVNAGIQLTEDGKYRNFLKILDDIKIKTQGMAEAQRLAFMRDVFGEQGELVISALFKTDDESFNNLLRKIEDSKEYSQKLSEVFDGGLGGAFKNLSSAIEGVSISFIEILAPSFVTITTAVTNTINIFTEFFNVLNSGGVVANTLRVATAILMGGFISYKAVILSVKTAQLILGATTTILTALQKGLIAVQTGVASKMIISTVATYGKAVALGVLTAVTKTATLAMGVLAGIVKVLGIAFSILTSPIGLIIAGCIGIGVVFYHIYKRSETLRKGVGWLINKFKELWGWIKKFTGIGAVLDFGKNAYNKAKNFFGFKDKIKDVNTASTEENKKKIMNTVETETKNIDNSAGKGVNTDYLLFGDNNTQGSSNSGKYVHNGYYLKGTKNLSNTSYRGIKNVTNANTSNVNNAVKNYTNSSLENVINNQKSVSNVSNNYNSTNNNQKNNYSDNIYNSYSTQENKVIEKTPEEKIIELLTNIKDLLGYKKSNDSKVQINISKENNEDIVSQVVEDLTIALGNM